MAGRQTIKEIEDLLGRGEYLAAYDLSSAASTRLEDDPSLQTRLGYLRVLSLARSGATRRAEADLEALISSMAADSPASVVEDILALRARLAKDRAFTLELASQAVAAGGSSTRRRYSP